MIITSKSTNISTFHEWFHEDYFDNLNAYEKFLNWISSEFALCQQYDAEDLLVYFPHGFFSIKKQVSQHNNIEYTIEVKSKCSKKGAQIFNKVKSVLTHIKTF